VSAKAAADADESSLDAAEKSAMLDSQRAFLDVAAAACATDLPKPDLSPFTVVMRINADGVVDKTWRKGDSPLALCIERYTRGKTVFVPPRSPLHSSFEISFDKRE